MRARLVVRRIRWTQLALLSVGSWLGNSACAEPATVDPSLVPEASIDSGALDGDANADGVADTSSGGSGGSGGSTGGTGGTGGTRSDAGDASDATTDASDASADVAAESSTDAPVVDMSVPPDGSRDSSTDPVSEPPADTSGRDGADAIVDIQNDRDG